MSRITLVVGHHLIGSFRLRFVDETATSSGSSEPTVCAFSVRLRRVLIDRRIFSRCWCCGGGGRGCGARRRFVWSKPDRLHVLANRTVRVDERGHVLRVTDIVEFKYHELTHKKLRTIVNEINSLKVVDIMNYITSFESTSLSLIKVEPLALFPLGPFDDFSSTSVLILISLSNETVLKTFFL